MAAAAVTVVALSAWGRAEGSLEAPTGLRLLIADVPAPFVLDVDRRIVQPIRGLPTSGHRGVSLLPAGEDALVLSYSFCSGCRPASGVYLLRRGSTVATRLAGTPGVIPSRDGRGMWMLRRRGPSRCTLHEVVLDGRPRRAPRPMSCRTELVAQLPAGLLVGTDSYSALVRPGGGLVRLGFADPRPVVADLVLTGGARRVPLVLHDLESGRSRRLAWPSRSDYALGEVTGRPSGRLAIVEFANAARQQLDMWLLDTVTRRWQHLPGVPARIPPKGAHVQWTADGRVVLLASATVAVWRPAEARLDVRRVRRPMQSDRRFLIWGTGLGRQLGS